MKIKICTLIGIIAFSSLAFADQLTGKITDSQTGEPIDQVSVYVENMNLYATSNTNGDYKISFLKPGVFKITFERIGYEKRVVEHNLFETSVLNMQLIKKPQNISGLKISSTKARERETPVTFTNLGNETIKEINYGQDIPMLMSEVPNVFSYSEAGNGFGYSHLKIRGFDQNRIGVMINGIPLNDPEDHQVYWVDMPDFAESTQDIQFQRGVGSSLYGVSTFGGSLNMQTNNLNAPNRTEIFSNFGSYNTYKYGVKTDYEILKNYKLNLRFSSINSDGYRNNSASEQWSYFANLSRIGERSITELNVYGGNELTHAAWYASSESDLEVNHQHNPIIYDNEIDDFSQPHFELHHSYFLADNANVKNTLFYIRGNGYYEQYKYDRDLWKYGLSEEENLLEADLIRKKNVNKNHYGWVSQYNLRHKMGSLTLGSYISLFDSEHWGEIKEVIGADTLSISYEEGQKYYNYTGDKQYITFYVNELFKPISNLSVMANLYFQKINYKFEQHEAGNFDSAFLNSYEVDYDFFNPRFGINYNLNEYINFYGNVSFAQREPSDDELYNLWKGPDDLGVTPQFDESEIITNENGDTIRVEWSEPLINEEKLTNYELGTNYDSGVLSLKLNFFWMDFKNEIVAYDELDDDWCNIRGNAEKTVHRGIEFSGKYLLPHNMMFSGSFSYNDNYFDEFNPFTGSGDYDYDGNKIAGFPDILANGRLSYKTDPLLISVQIQHVGKQYLDNTENEDRTIDPFQVVNASVIYKLTKLFGKSDIELNLRINNILDKEYETAGYYDSWGSVYGPPGNYYFPAAGRNFMAGVRVGF
ncbi:MAG: TonB-dependent receptor [Candidatus Cloacimonetes bacterium]|nr:TonB-dependent receptor [Candidatus Cloacimonadota bacterium]